MEDLYCCFCMLEIQKKNDWVEMDISYHGPDFDIEKQSAFAHLSCLKERVSRSFPILAPND
jgi:hypothetical protein